MSDKKVSVDSDNFQSILIGALRYSIGRQTYMPHTVMGYIRPLIPYLSDKTLYVMIRDIEEAKSWGNPVIDAPEWSRFLANLKTEYQNRKTD